MSTESLAPSADTLSATVRRLHSQDGQLLAESALSSHRINDYLQEIAYHEPLTALEEESLLKGIQHNDREAWHELLEMHLRLVLRIARSYHDQAPYALIDLIEAGNVALIAAARQLVVGGNERFAIYATRHICQHLDSSMPVRGSALA
ncbi:hypothetical protein [Acidithiobacillus concretivorus]|uniref:RNA polymerase sigma-70 region 2 domain-containing protein n=1 Tax=Acidithiobacillus concretivorus TaxID=3063952 RepID=A0ABS5ZMG4_9PROT|nr:hypothetical protein [Acidithiobacillus concretivorus]MBU2737797.1 hypothetical protein [Acidithiobacillus concretivorus]